MIEMEQSTVSRVKQGITANGNIYWRLFLRLLLVMGLLSLCRLGFYLYNTDYFTDLSPGHFLWLMWGGLRFDLVALLYFNVLYILLLIIPVDVRFNHHYKRVSNLIFLLANGTMLAVNVADFIYYRFTLRRTTADVLSQFSNEKNAGMLWLRFIIDYWYAVAFWLGLMILLVFVTRRIRIGQPQGYSRKKSYLFSVVAVPLLGFLIWGGIRGGFRHSTRPITLADAGEYVKDPKDISIVLNTPFSIIRTWGKTKLQRVSFYQDDVLEKIYSPVHHPQDSIPLRPDNVVVIVLESFSKEFVGAYQTNKAGHQTGYTPFLDSLIQFSRTFRYSFANGRKSIDALPSVLSGIPSLGVPYVLSPYSGDKINSLASLLKEKSYHTSFFHGAPNGSMGFQAFVNLAGVDHYYGMDEYDNEDDFDGMWGIWDEPFLNFYAEKLNTFPQPFFSTVFSVSSHHPFEIPAKYKNTFPGGPMVIHKCIEYTDYALKKFFQKASGMPWYKNTLFVITADHTSSEVEFPEGRTGWGLYAIPVIFFTPDHSLTGMRDDIVQQTDIMPTILSYLSYDGPFVAFGQDALDENRKPFALNFHNNVYQYFEGDYLLQFDGIRSAGLYNFRSDILMKRNLIRESPTVVEEMERSVKAIIQQYNNRIIADELTVGDYRPAISRR